MHLPFQVEFFYHNTVLRKMEVCCLQFGIIIVFIFTQMIHKL